MLLSFQDSTLTKRKQPTAGRVYLPLVKVTGLHVEQYSVRLLPLPGVSEDIWLYSPPR